MTKLLLITGLSGAGKSTALNALEDAGYETIDNVPLSLLPMLINSGQQDENRMVVAGVDIRSRDFSPNHLSQAVDAIRAARKHKVEIVFLTCEEEVLQRRYTETRRRHPLAHDRPVGDGIAHEKQLISPIQQWADWAIDTTFMKPSELRALVQQRFATLQGTLSIFIQSFSFRSGLPRDADLVFDVRFLRNPHYEENLRSLTGRDKEVAAYIQQDKAYNTFFSNLVQLLIPLLPRYQQEGKSYLTIAIGCTGGKHRSVFVAEQLSAFLQEQGYAPQHRHRDLPV